MPIYEALGSWAGRIGTWKEGDHVELGAEKAEPFLAAGLLELLDDDEGDEGDEGDDEPTGASGGTSGAAARHVKTSGKRSGSKTVRSVPKERL